MDNQEKRNVEQGAPEGTDSSPFSSQTATFRLIPALVKRIKTLQTQTLLLTLALLLVLGGFTVVLGGWVTHRLKQHLVIEARDYAREEVGKSCREIQEIMKQRGVESVASAADLPEVTQRIRLILRRMDGAVQMVAVLNPDYTVVRQYHNNQVSSVREVEGDKTVQGEIDDGKANYTLTVERIEPPPSAKVASKADVANAGGQPAGYLAFRMADNLSGSHRMQRMSSAVTESLGWMVGLLLLILALAMALLYKIFTRHLVLVKDKDAQAKMAAIGTLASGLAHEIRNPLQVINMNLEVIKEDLEENAPGLDADDRGRTTKVLSGVQGQITHLNQILHDFMQFAIPGRMEKEELSLRCLIGDTLEFMTPELERHQVETRLDVPETARISGDSSALRRVFLNILLNAVRAMEESDERRLTIDAEPDRSSGGWRIRVQDTGCGIPEDKEEEIFEAFVSFRPGGTGFGLAIARRIIEEHGGSIRAERPPHGGGAVFRIVLPGLEAEAQSHTRSRPAASAAPRLS